MVKKGIEVLQPFIKPFTQGESFSIYATLISLLLDEEEESIAYKLNLWTFP